MALRAQPDRIIGTVGCFWVSRSDRCMELGYALTRDYWGNGLVVEGARTVLDHVFAHYPVDRLQCHCLAENAASARVIETLGMRREGLFRSCHYQAGPVPGHALFQHAARRVARLKARRVAPGPSRAAGRDPRACG